MKNNELKDLITYIDQSSIREFNLETCDYKLYVNKNEISTLSKQDTVINEGSPVTERTDNQAAPTVAENPAEVPTEGEFITSPLVGIANTSSDPTSSPFKQVGDVVKVGETVCIVESMKIMNDIPSPVSGTISKVLFSNEEVVEYGQPLFEIESK